MISAKLDPTILPKQTGGLKAERTFHRVTFTPSSAKPGETLYVSVPNLSEGIVLVPNSLALRFDLGLQPSTADERYAVNNLGRNVISKLKIKFAGETAIDLSRPDLYYTYKDLFLKKEDRAARIDQGIGGVILRKVRSPIKTQPTDTAPATAVAEAKGIKAAYGTKYTIPFDFEPLTQHGVFYPRVLHSEMQFEITLADASNIIQGCTTALTGDQTYSMTNLELQYETIQSDVLAYSADRGYASGKAFLYEHVNLYKTFAFLDKTDELITQSINIPRRSLTGLLLLFVKPHGLGLRDSEAFVNPNITQVGINVNGMPNKVFSQGIRAGDIYNEVVRRFGNEVTPGDFYQKKYALWVDLRATNDNTIHGGGLKLVNTQDGVVLEIKRTKDSAADAAAKINCYIFVVADAQMSIEQNQLKSIAY